MQRQRRSVLEPQRRCAVVGHPVAHSLSPVMHKAAYRELGLDWQFDAIDVPEDGWDGFIAGLGPEYVGLAVTMPHKSAAARTGRPDRTVQRLGVANTVIFADGGPRAYNTDVAGFIQALQYRRLETVSSAVVLGAGATAKAALLALAGLGVAHVTSQVRDVTRADLWLALADELGVEACVEPLGTHNEVDLVVSTLPAESAAPWADVVVEMAQVIFDSSYHPWPTPLTDAAWAAGRPAITGLDLLAGQAVFQLDLMTGETVDFETLHRAGHDELARGWKD